MFIPVILGDNYFTFAAQMEKIKEIYQYQEVLQMLLKAKHPVISTHANPDGDTIGSALGLYHFLKAQGVEAQLIGQDLAPSFLQWLPGYEHFILWDKQGRKLKKTIQQADVIVHVDYNAFHRAGTEVAKLLDNATATHLIIDHHPYPDEIFAAKISAPSACATAQLVYALTQAHHAHIVSQKVATALYVGIMTDTGSFSFGMTNEQPYLIAADLVKSGIDDRWIHQQVYNNNSLNRLQLTGYALSSKLEVFAEGSWAMISLSKAELKQYHYRPGDTEGLVNQALSVKGVQMAVLLTEQNGMIRLSFRSQGDFAVNTIASEHFNGGGHKNAAGGRSYTTLNKTIEQLKTHIKPYEQELISRKFES